MAPLTVGSPSAGGTASLIVDNYYHQGFLRWSTPGTHADVTAANIMYAAEQGAAGVRVYMFGGDANQNQALNSCFANCTLTSIRTPFTTAPKLKPLAGPE